MLISDNCLCCVDCYFVVFFFKQKTAYEMRISYWSSDVCSSDLATNRRIFSSFDEGEGSPDGMTIDAAGDLWVAFWDGWCLRRFSPDGSCRETLQVPFQRPTSCAFAGPQLDRLVITSARTGLSENELELGRSSVRERMRQD